MPAHPTLPESDAHQIVAWILSLAGNKPQAKSLPPSGTITPPHDMEPNTALVISATYTDNGGNNIKALTASNALALPSSHVTFMRSIFPRKSFVFADERRASYCCFPGISFNGPNPLLIYFAPGTRTLVLRELISTPATVRRKFSHSR